MKIGIVSDTHSNEHALRSVLEHMKSVGVDKKVHLGDIVGYGPRPNETLALTLEHFNYIVKGNHDYACEREENSWGFNPMAKESINWTISKLSKEEIEVLSSLPYAQNIGDIMFVHGSPYSPFDYMLNEEDAKLGFSNNDFKIAFVGHTHVPMLWTETTYNTPNDSYTELKDGIAFAGYSFGGKNRAIINVGSVGQPRNGDPRASYVTYDTETQTVEFYKIPYAVDRVVGQMQRAGFDERHYRRFIFGR